MSVKRARRENLLDVEPPLGQPLLNRVVQQGLQCGLILLHRVRPGIRAEQRSLLFLFGAEPGQIGAAVVGPILICTLLGIFKNAHQLRSDLGIALEYFVLDDDNMANWENSGAAIVIRLHLAIVGP